MKIVLKMIYIAIISLTFLNFRPANAFAWNPEYFQILINNGDSKTYSSKVKIKVRYSENAGYSGAGWYCLPGSDGWQAGIEFNNTGNSAYKNLGDGVCVDGWSYFDWDLAGFDGNASLGIKTVHFQMSVAGGGGSQWTTRSILLEEKPVVIDPPKETITPKTTPKPPKQTITKSPTTTPKNNSPTSTSQKISDIVKEIDEAGGDEQQLVGAVSDSKQEFRLFIASLFGVIVGMVSVFGAVLIYKKFNKKV